ncbi:MAG TPA: metallophosphoesterase [Kofleriaceae bacterium]|nr:metallophosphoesterase [Kofleriaceae bacterium]
MIARRSIALAAAAVTVTALVLTACTRPGDDRPLRDEEIGHATIDNITIDVDDGLAHIRSFANRELDLWLQSPVIDLTIDAVDSSGPITITAQNVLPDAELTGALSIAPLGGPRPTVRSWTIDLPPGRSVIRIAPPDVLDRNAWTFAVMGDIQDALPTVDEVFAAIDAQPGLRFVISTGDIVHRGREDEWKLFEQQLTTLDIPFYSTIGNHELWGDIDRWYRRFGRATVHFDYRGVAFSLVDSASAGLDPLVDDELDTWLAQHADDIHVFGTHYPPIDPVGVRMGSFASRREAQALLARLAAAHVDVTFYGHIHTYADFENAGIPAYISGGGGAEPMRLDGIDRHFLVVAVDPSANAITNVHVVRVD